jgi:hypothetical protein
MAHPRNNTGINNSKSYLNEYLRTLRTRPATTPKPNSVLPLCNMLLNMMGEQAYNEWIETAPDDNAAFVAAVTQKLKELTIGR